MLFKSRERQVYDHICQELEGRLARSGAPGEIRQFLLEHWSYLLAGVYFSHGDQHPDWVAGWHTVNALLWSLVPKRDQVEMEQFLRLLPTLLGRLQDGCDAMGLNAAGRDELFSMLAVLHAAVARPGLQVAQNAVGQLAPDPDQAFSEAELAGLDAETPVKAPLVDEHVQDTAGIDSLPDPDQAFSEAELAGLDAETPVKAPLADEHVQDTAGIDKLKVGDGVRFLIEGQTKTLVLQWISPMRGMYLFADDTGFEAISLTRARLAEKLHQGEVSLGE